MATVNTFNNRREEFRLLAHDNPLLGISGDETGLEFLQAFMDVEFENAGGSIPFEAEGLLSGQPFYYRERHGVASLRVSKNTLFKTRLVRDFSSLNEKLDPRLWSGDTWTKGDIDALPMKEIWVIEYPHLPEMSDAGATQEVREFREGWGWLETFIRLVESLEQTKTLYKFELDGESGSTWPVWVDSLEEARTTVLRNWRETTESFYDNRQPVPGQLTAEDIQERKQTALARIDDSRISAEPVMVKHYEEITPIVTNFPQGLRNAEGLFTLVLPASQQLKTI